MILFSSPELKYNWINIIVIIKTVNEFQTQYFKIFFITFWAYLLA
jgi:hypothetical protein